MTPSDTIITSVRQYCLDLNQSGLSTQQSIADGLLNGVEYFVGQQFKNISELKREIIMVAKKNLAIQTSYYSKPGHIKQIELEWQKFVYFVERLNPKSLTNIRRLSFRRRLTETESSLIRQNLEMNWNFDGGYWEPLVDCSPKPFCYYPCEGLNNSDYQKLIDTLLILSSDTVYEVSEHRLDYEIEH